LNGTLIAVVMKGYGYGSPKNQKPLSFDNNSGVARPGITLSVDSRWKSSSNDRDRRRQIIAKLAQKRQQYQRGIGQSERESFQRRVKSSIAKHKQQQRRQTQHQLLKPKRAFFAKSHREPESEAKDLEEEECASRPARRYRHQQRDEEQKSQSASVSSSVSASPIGLKSQEPETESPSPAPSPIARSKRHRNDERSADEHENAEEDSESPQYSDGRVEEGRMLRAQNTRLTNKVEHVSAELVETQVFLRSERKRNKNLFAQLKLKEEEITQLNQTIDELELEMDEKHAKHKQCATQLSEAKQRIEALEEQVSAQKEEGQRMADQVGEWRQKLERLEEEYGAAGIRHQKQVKRMQNTLAQATLAEEESLEKIKALVDEHADEIQALRDQMAITEEHSIENVKAQVRAHDEQLQAMRKEIADAEQNSLKKVRALVHTHEAKMQEMRNEKRTLVSAVDSVSEVIRCNETSSLSQSLRALLSDASDINVLVQSVLGVVGRLEAAEQHSEQMSAYCTKYEQDVEALSNTVLGLEEQCSSHQVRLQESQRKFASLSREKAKSDAVSSDAVRELQQLRQTVASATKDMRNLTEQAIDGSDAQNMNIAECVRVIAESVQHRKLKDQRLRLLMMQMTTKQRHQMDSVHHLFRNANAKWSERIDVLQDKLSLVQIELLRKNGVESANLSSMSIVSMSSMVSVPDDIESQFSEQMAVINELKQELCGKQQTIEDLAAQSGTTEHKEHDTMRSELEQAHRERDEAVADFQNIAEEWQTMEANIDETYGNHEALGKRMDDDWQCYIKRIVEHIERRVNRTDDPSLDHTEFEGLSTNVPDSLGKLHHALMQLLAQNSLHDLNETRLPSDDALLEQLFGNIEDEEQQTQHNDDARADDTSSMSVVEADQHSLANENASSKIEVSALQREAKNEQCEHEEAMDKMSEMQQKYLAHIKQIQAESESVQCELVHTQQRLHQQCEEKALMTQQMTALKQTFENQVLKLLSEHEQNEQRLQGEVHALHKKLEQRTEQNGDASGNGYAEESMRSELDSKTAKFREMKDVYTANLQKLSVALEDAEQTRIDLEARTKSQCQTAASMQEELRRIREEFDRVQIERARQEQRWTDREDRLCSEVSVLRQHLQQSTHELGVLKVERDTLSMTVSNNDEEQQSVSVPELEASVARLEAELCVESVVHKVELSHVGSEAERLIAAYQHRLKAYHQFIRQLQEKVEVSAKLINSLTLERDHSWTQFQGLQKQVNEASRENARLQSENQTLQCSISENEQELQRKTEGVNKLMEQSHFKLESLSRQLQTHENTNQAMQQRLHVNTATIQQITAQRDELQRECISLSHKFREYQHFSDQIFKRSCYTLATQLHPLQDRLNQYGVLSERMQGIQRKVDRLRQHLKQEKVAEADQLEEVRKQCDKSALSKLRMHADIHRFQFAKMLQEMKQKYLAHIEQINTHNDTLQHELAQTQQTLQHEHETKVSMEQQLTQLTQLQQSFEGKMSKLRRTQSERDQNEQQLQGVVRALQQELAERQQHWNQLQREMKHNAQQHGDTQSRLTEQTQKTKALHAKSVKQTAELQELRSEYSLLLSEKRQHAIQRQQLETLNSSLKAAMEAKSENHRKMEDIYDAKIEKLSVALHDAENANLDWETRGEGQRAEVASMEVQLRRMREELDHGKSERAREERRWLDKEEDLRSEVNILRSQLHQNTNELGVMKLELLEKTSECKKLQSEAAALREESRFFSEREQREKREREALSAEVSQHDQQHARKLEDIQMILDAKAVRIMRLQEEVQNKEAKVCALETEVIELRNEVAAVRVLMRDEKSELLQSQSMQTGKLQSIIDDITSELESIKAEKGQLRTELETQKHVNVQLSMELGSIKLSAPEVQRYEEPEPQREREEDVMDADTDDVFDAKGYDLDDVNVTALIQKTNNNLMLNGYSEFEQMGGAAEDDSASSDVMIGAERRRELLGTDDDDDDDENILRNLNLVTPRNYGVDRDGRKRRSQTTHTKRRRPGLPLPK